MAKLAWAKYCGRRVYFARDPYDDCHRKTRYDTELSARMGAQAKMPAAARGGCRRWVYPCLACNGWHATSCDHQKSAAVTATQLWEGVDGVPPDAIPTLRKAAR